MKFKLEIQQFIQEHPDNWEQLIQEAPYFVTVLHDEKFGRKFIMFKYSQIDSNFNLSIVRECRGLILDEDTLEPISVPFFKFGNAGESYCPEIDWSSCWVGEKLDGSIIKVVKFGKNLLISTNGTIDAFKAPLAEQIGCKAANFGELVEEAIHNEFHPIAGGISAMDWFASLLDEGKTYMFELTSPFNKVVVQWHETRLNFLGVRDNVSLQETYFTEHPLKDVFHTPKVFSLHSLQECIEAAEKLGPSDEGYVVCDKDFNRVKVKSVLYVSLHHLRGENGIMSYRRALEIVKRNEVSEVLTYFPEYKSAFDDLFNRFNNKLKELESVWNNFNACKDSLLTRKDQAIWLTSHCKTSGILFAMLDGKITSIYDGLYNMSNENILKMLGYKNIK
jgi:hypothetical protein